MNRNLVVLIGAAMAVFSQDPPVEGDRERRVWSTEFRQSRSATAAPAKKAPARPALVGITLWRLRPSHATDQARLIVHEEDNGGIEFTPERISLSTRLLPNDRIRLSIESAQNGYLYVASQEAYAGGELGKPYLIFPSKRIYSGSNRVEARRPIDIPELSNRRPYLTLKRSRPDQVAEVLTILVTPAPLAGMMVQSQPTPINAAEWETQKKKWGTRVERIETGAGPAWTVAEKAAAEGKGSLGAADPLPHTLFRASQAHGMLFSVPLSLTQ